MLEELEKSLGYHYKDLNLLKHALTHSSCSVKINENYERLEFLGDRVLGLAVAAMLCKIFPREPEGSLAQRHTALVCKDTVAEVARRLHLDKYLFVGNEEIRSNENVLCDVGEALIASIFKDGGFDAAFALVSRNWSDLIDKNTTPPKDAKTSLQEVAHIRGWGVPVYKVVRREGSEHEPVFYISVQVGGREEVGSGRSKKLAEQNAAGKVLDTLGEKYVKSSCL